MRKGVNFNPPFLSFLRKIVKKGQKWAKGYTSHPYKCNHSETQNIDSRGAHTIRSQSGGYTGYTFFPIVGDFSLFYTPPPFYPLLYISYYFIERSVTSVTQAIETLYSYFVRGNGNVTKCNQVSPSVTLRCLK